MVSSRRPRRSMSRVLLLRIAVVLAFVTLAGQLWRLQIVQGDTFRWRANNNRFRVLPELAARGVIYDRQGSILARNRPRYQVVVVPEDLPEEKAEQARVLRRLIRLLETPIPTSVGETGRSPSLEEILPAPGGARPVTETTSASPAPSGASIALPVGRQAPAFPSLEELQAKISEAAQESVFRPVLVSDNIPRDAALLIQEESGNLPGIQVQVQPRREYPSGALTAHIVGYTGPIPRESVDVYVEE